ncbi:DeoR/GlpR family DNA-binding transcription regulator [Parafrankia soli]|uniref:DeoR/GlpR family DNA-binding transcription regulator n=1 Tax=Parafrankia soli TaxID=2599596 RepID=UPI0009F62A25|nr:DeoR/GlpR family DNA-binding transcription regulator [Parafrankia soli]
MSLPQRNVPGEDRLTWLSDQLRDQGAVTITAAAAALNVSEMTIRRDLFQLEERGVARRVRGGARSVGPRSFAQRRDRMAAAKSRIAAKLAELVPDGGAVAFDASSTVMRLAGALTSADDLLVVTNGPDTFGVLRDRPGISVLLTGGRLDPRTGSLVGPLASRAAADITVRRLFASAAALDERAGPLEETPEEADVKRALAAGAEQIVLAVDSSKLGTRAVARWLDWDRVDWLVTELDPQDDRLAPYRRVTRLR